MTGSRPEDRALPYVLTPETPGDDAMNDPSRIRALLRHHGAVLLRGFAISGMDGFEYIVRTLSGAPLAYSERSSPRQAIQGDIYTSTDYPPHREIFLHNENSYQSSWPRTLYFYCAQPPDTLGATPLADIRRVHASIDPAVRAEFNSRKWMLVRNFHEGFGLHWRYVFNTKDRLLVKAYCKANHIASEWRSQDGLRTTAIREAIRAHPETGATLWFNHIAFFHHTTLPLEIQNGLLALFDEEDLPSNTFYGDGGIIPDEVVAHLRDCYRAASVRFDWAQDDLLIIDNMLTAHGREPFSGPRRIAVAMASLYPPEGPPS
jgi:alpha-ketoglutarate-dependent taurine dioxygenase